MKRLSLLPLLFVACGGVEVPTPIEPEVVIVHTECPAAQPLNAPRPLVRVDPAVEPARPVEPGVVSRVLRDQTTEIALALTTDTVFCSAIGYSEAFLKVSVPDLDWLAHFDHRVEQTGLPCAAAGACSDTVGPDTILSTNPALSVVPVRVVLTENLTIDPVARTCTRQLVETVTVQLADRVLRHHVDGEETAYPYEKCAALAGR